jgi:hypothetical protein
MATHEFGHILGIRDGYNSAKTETTNSIMCDPWEDINKIDRAKRKATRKDIAKALNAYKSNKVQS